VRAYRAHYVALAQPVQASGAGLPQQGNNVAAFGQPDKRQADALALAVAQEHRKGRLAKSQRDLLAELHTI
jgi:hypothetical protein